MANYYSDHPEIEFHLNHPLMKRVVDLKERNYVEKDQFEDAPVNYEDAIENYKRLLDITGDVAANIIEPNSEDVDLERSTPGEWPHDLCQQDIREPRCHPQGRPLGLVHATSLRRLEPA